MNKLDYIIKQLQEGRKEFSESLDELDRKDAEKLAKAKSDFKNFTSKRSTRVDKVKINIDNVGYELGKLVAVIYQADTEDGKGTKYKHDFNKRNQPRLVVTNDGLQLVIVGGRYKVNSKKGIIG
jgi:hypothetical protein